MDSMGNSDNNDGTPLSDESELEFGLGEIVEEVAEEISKEVAEDFWGFSSKKSKKKKKGLARPDYN